MFSHFYNILGCLFIGLVICQSASVDWIRIKKDTRNISSDKFKPLQPSSVNVKESPTPVSNDSNHHSTFQEHSTAEARSRFGSSDANTEDSLWPPTPRYPDPSRFNHRTSLPFPPDRFNSPNLDSALKTNLDVFSPSVFRKSSFTGPMPLSIQTGQRMSTSNGFFTPINNFEESDFAGGFPNNFYRSESYSFSTHGSEAPRIQQSVFDSRLGSDMITRNF